MAGIDKTYTSSWEEYQSLVEWCKGKSFTLKNGDIIYPREYIYKWSKEDFNGKKELPIWNTPTYLDIWLIRNCPLKFIQDRLKEQYGGGWSKMAFTEHNEDGFKFPLRSDVIMRLEDADFMYERLIGIIERVIKEDYFNKDYLEEEK